MLINNPVITGSFTVNGVNVAGITGSSELSSSYLTLSASFLTTSASYASASGSLSTRVTNLEATSSTVSSSFATTSGSIAGRVTLIEGQYATTGSNNFTAPQRISDVSNAISFTSTASLYTDGGLRVKGSSFVSGTAYFNDVVVYGTSSIEYITSSQLAIGTNIITLNTDTPSIRFGGISVFDSGSNNLSTGSLFWDSEKDKWIYSNPSASTYDGGMLISGPRNTSGLGNEVGTTSCALMMGQGGDHITSSAIFSYGNATCFYGNSYISSSGLACFAGTVCVPTNLVLGTNNSYALYLRDSTGAAKPVIATAGNTNLNFYNVCSTGQIQFRNAADNAVLTSINNSGSATFNSTDYNVANFNSTYGQSNINIQTNGSTIAVLGSGVSVTATAGACDVGIGTAGLNNSIVFATGTGYAERMRITGAGLVGIGASPLVGTGAALQIEQATSNIVAIRRADCSNTGSSRILFQAYNASGLIQNTGIVEAGLDSSATNGYIGFYAGTAAMNMKITAAGTACFSGTVCALNFVSPGITNSTSAVCSNYIKTYCDTSDTRYLQLYMGNPATYNPASAGTVCKIVSGVEFNWYSENWKIGATRGGGADIADFVFGINNATRMTITSGGNVGIGATSPSYKLQVGDLANTGGVKNDIFITGDTVNTDAYYARLIFGNSSQSGGSTASIRGERKTSNYATELTFYTNEPGSPGNGCERLRINSAGNLQVNFNPGNGQLFFQDVTNGATMFYVVPATYVGSAPYNANRILAANSSHIAFETGGTERLRLNSVGGFGTQLCNFCLTSSYQTLVTVENGSYGLLMLSSCLGGGTYALYAVFNNAGATSATLITGNNIPACVVGNAVRFASANGATYCDMRSSYIRFY